MAKNDDKAILAKCKGVKKRQRYSAELSESERERGDLKAIMFVPKNVKVQEDEDLQVEVVVVSQDCFQLIVQMRT